MATSETTSTEQLGPPGAGCPSCGYPLAVDQRYCLECGYRRAASRVPYATLLTGREPEEVLQAPPAPPEPLPAPPRFGPQLMAGAAGGAAALLLGLGLLLGFLIGGAGEEPQQIAAPVQKPPIVNITNTGGGPVAAEEFTEDWPAGENGWTVQLEVLPKDSTDVAAVTTAKGDAESAGAPDVGALDSDGYSSLKAGNYVVYSGVFTGEGGKAKAQAALKELRKDFPQAKVVKVASADAAFGVEGQLSEEKVETVDDGSLEDLESSTGLEQQKKSAQLPDTIGTEGEAPQKDGEQPGGGTDGEEVIE
jgi:uncharacterized protein YidB (DUF937 family)